MLSLFVPLFMMLLLKLERGELRHFSFHGNIPTSASVSLSVRATRLVSTRTRGSADLLTLFVVGTGIVTKILEEA